MSGRAWLLAGIVVVVVAAVVAAFFVLESPAEERRRRLDEQRVADLQALANSVDAYWSREDVLPADLGTLDGWEGFDAPRHDPVTDAPYEYRVTGDSTFELCATFATDTPDHETRRPVWPHQGRFWHHPAGDHCFELEAEKLER